MVTKRHAGARWLASAALLAVSTGASAQVLSPPVAVGKPTPAPMSPAEQPGDPEGSFWGMLRGWIASIGDPDDVPDDAPDAAPVGAVSETGGAAAGRTFHIDHAAGNDNNDGLSPARPWRTAPGDTQATGRPAATRLLPGDRLLFRGGVRYRGAIRLRASGTAERPIVLDGSGWGTSRAIIDGSNALPAPTACRSAAACLGAPNWRQLQRIAIPAGHKWHDWLFADDRPMTLAQWPPIADVMEADDLERFAALPRSAAAVIRTGLVPASALPPLPAGIAAGEPVLRLWSSANEIERFEAPTFTGAGISFTPDGFQPATHRDGRLAIVNTPAAIDAPGKYAVSGKDRVIVLWPLNRGSRYSLGARRTGIFLLPSQHVTIRGFSFANGNGPPDMLATGNAVFGNNGTTGVRIEQNIFQSYALLNGDGVVHLSNARDARIVGNEFRRIPFASGFRSGSSEGPMEVSCNIMRDVGRTGIGLFSVLEARVRGNDIRGVVSAHGNAISVYSDSRLVEVSGNVVTDALRPLTLSGPGSNPHFGTGGATASISIRDNVLIATEDDAGAISSWGARLTNVSITGNFLSAPRTAVRFMGTEANITLDGNQLVGTALSANRQPIFQGVNQTFAPDGNGRALTADAAARTVPAGLCGAGI